MALKQLNITFYLIYRCRARARTKQDGKHVEIVDPTHNHQLISKRRKKGHLKKMLAMKKSQKKWIKEIDWIELDNF